MQIMLRTHSDLGYKQEQRFHLELGLLKLVHAQRLLPLEQLLSGEVVKAAANPGRAGTSLSAAGAASARTAAAPPLRAAVPETLPSRTSAASPFKGPSPFEADRSRKSEPKAEAPEFIPPLPPRSEVNNVAPSPKAEVVVGAAVAVADEPPPAVEADVNTEALRVAVLRALEDANQQMLAHNLESGEWSLRGNEITVKVAMSQVMCDVALGDAPRRIVTDALTKASGRPMKVKMVSGGAQFAPKVATSAAPRPGNGAGARSRAMADPVVQRMQEKFGAEIRSVIDHKDRG